jgi:hypothetical protein
MTVRHGDVEPVDEMLGLGIEVQGQVAHILSAVGQEGDLLIGLHPLRLQHLEEPSLRVGVVVGWAAAELPPVMGRYFCGGLPPNRT